MWPLFLLNHPFHLTGRVGWGCEREGEWELEGGRVRGERWRDSKRVEERAGRERRERKAGMER